MGPTNTNLVQLFHAERDLRDAQERLDAATKNVRLQQRRVTDAGEKLAALQTKIREQQAKIGQYELEIRTRDAQIEKLRNQQQAARNNKEYQAFLIEINTAKVDKSKAEEASLKVMETLEADQKLAAETATALASEQEKLTAMQSQIGERTVSLQAEVARLTPIRDEMASKLPPKARDAFARLADRYDGEAMSPLIQPVKGKEEYLCTACHMELVRDVYNRLHSRDDLVFCTSCGRILYIPENLTPEVAVIKPKERKPQAERKPSGRSKPAPPATTGRQSSAADVLRSIQVEDEGEPAPPPVPTTRVADTTEAEASTEATEITEPTEPPTQSAAAEPGVEEEKSQNQG
jgi:predicted  nucleic acid-binding Zn-ribbon protein